ncbi:MAG: Sua5/YciO/YrdC/YwlC family protein, partial [Synechocystis sp.]|nr:Sua5/YciO/YrdC/YwlC family protein [Synechocystis sp.]
MVLVSQADLIQGAIAGQVVSFPTDTVPALAVRPDQSGLIYQLKQRDLNKPLILMAATV